MHKTEVGSNLRLRHKVLFWDMALERPMGLGYRRHAHVELDMRYAEFRELRVIQNL